MVGKLTNYDTFSYLFFSSFHRYYVSSIGGLFSLSLSFFFFFFFFYTSCMERYKMRALAALRVKTVEHALLH